VYASGAPFVVVPVPIPPCHLVSVKLVPVVVPLLLPLPLSLSSMVVDVETYVVG